MKKFTLASLLFLIARFAPAQITYIGISNHNTGTGSNNLFNNYVAVGQQCYIDWEVYADGMTNMEACGFRSNSRLILRRMANSDSTSVIASAPIIVPGICGGKNGNNDKYYAELSSYLDKPGRYSVEIQADLPNQTNEFGNATTKTTNNYACPSVYYLTGTSGPTGNYYTPSGTCAGGPGLSDPVGGPSADMLTEIFPALKFFTVGESAAYREMVLFDGKFYDLEEGRFQPGNPALPASLNGKGNIPAAGICPIIIAPSLSMGSEINSFKRTDCGNADVTGAAMFYRVYKDGTIPPAYSSFPLAFKDDCSFSPNGPEGNIFPAGGSCQNANGILDQRWQSITGVSNILPGSFSLTDTGLWKIECYTETYVKNCAGTASVQQGTINTSTFTVDNPLAPGSSCSTVIPVILSSFTVTPNNNNNLLAWIVEEASQVTGFTIQRSFDGYTFSSIGTLPYTNGRSSFNYTDAAYPGQTVFYRIILDELSGKVHYSSIVSVNSKTGGTKITIQPSAQSILVKLENFSKGNYQLNIYTTAGSLVEQSPVIITLNGNTNISPALKTRLAHGIYYAVMRDEKGNIIARQNFYY
ncbi:MAG: hypothetical protein IPP72_10815 [Chitinophagaceae bacterium]|nr:hypothetical protein [Chitinophagaceae bacterium]